MGEAVTAALITGGVSLLGSVFTLVMQNRLTAYRIDQLEAKVDKHNDLVERMAVVEQSAKSAHHRLDEIAKR